MIRERHVVQLIDSRAAGAQHCSLNTCKTKSHIRHPPRSQSTCSILRWFLAVFALHIGFLSSLQAQSPLSMFSSVDLETSAKPVVWPYRFPVDHYPHTQHSSELWQILGFIGTESGQSFFVDTKLLRLAISPKRLQRAKSSWQFQQVYGLSQGLVNQQKKAYKSQVTVAREALRLSGFDQANREIRVNQQKLKLIAEEECALATEIEFTHQHLTFQSSLVAEECPILPMQEVATVSHGYVQPMRVVSGSVEQQKIISGRVWLLHSWGRFPAQRSPIAVDQFSIPIDDHTLLKITRTRRSDGSGRPVLSAEQYISGTSESIDYRRLNIIDIDFWTSGKTAKRYSHGWTLSWPGYRAKLEPYIVEQELEAFGQTRWSGVVQVELIPDHRSDADVGVVPQKRRIFGFAEISPSSEEAS